MLVTGVCVFISQDIIIKALSGGYPIHEMLLIRCITGFPFVLAFALWRRNPLAFRVRNAGIVRGVLHYLSFTSYYMALASLPLAEVATLYYANPLFITALSVPFLHDKVGPRRWMAVMVGFVGVVAVLRPDVDTVDPAMLFALGAALLYAASMLVTRANSDIPATGFAMHSMTILFILSGLTGLLIGDGHLMAGEEGLFAFMLRPWVMPGGLDLLLLAAIGPISAAGFMLLAEAYRVAPPSLVTPFEYSSLPFAVVGGYLFFGDLPAPTTWIGLALIAGAGLYIVHREAICGRRPTAPRSGRP